MKKAVISFGIILSVMLSCVNATAVGYTENSLSNFIKVRSYSEGTFTDIAGWYVDYVKEAYDYGIVSGVGGNRFAPQNKLSAQEAITIGASIHAIYKYGYDAANSKLSAYDVPNSLWYTKYIAYAKAENIIGNEFDSLIGKEITRAQMIHCWSKVLLPADLPKVNTVKSLPDVNETTEYKADIFMMYEAGILTGTDDKGTFKPNQDITRAECSTMFMRLIDKSSRFRGHSFPVGETIMIGDVPFNSNTDVEVDEFTGSSKITIAKQNEFIDSMLSKSEGLTINNDLSVIDIDFNLIPLPEGFTWEIRIEWGGDRWMGARLLADDPALTTAVKPINGHFISKLWRENEPMPTYITFGANIQGAHGSAGTVFIQYNVDNGSHSINYGDKNNSVAGYEHWYGDVFHIDR